MPTHIWLFLDVPEAAWPEATSFWAAVTGWTPSVPRGESDQFLTLEPPAGDSWLKMQAVPGSSGVHLDLDSDDRGAQVARAAALGATSAWTYHDVPVVRSPGGFTFCHTLGDGGRVPPRAAATVLDQVCLDVPASLWDDEVAFWTALTGRELRAGSVPGFVSLADPAGGLRILLQRLGEEDGTVRGHPDLASRDRAEETRRHVSLGARTLAEHPVWTTLVAPGGQVYCITDRDPATGRLGD